MNVVLLAALVGCRFLSAAPVRVVNDGVAKVESIPRFDLRRSHRFVFDAERTLPWGMTFLPAARYSAVVEKLSAEMRFEKNGKTIARFAAPTNVAPPYVMHLMATGTHKPSVFVTKDGKTSLASIADWPKGFDPRTAALTNPLLFERGYDFDPDAARAKIIDYTLRLMR